MNNQRYFFILLMFLTYTGCESPSKLTTTNPDEFKPEELNISKFTINENPLILTKGDLISKYGEPDTIRFGGSFQPTKHDLISGDHRKTLIEYQNYIYPHVFVAVWGNNAQVNFINFTNTDLILNHPLISLSRKTHIDEIKAIFPYSYEWRNLPLHGKFGLDPEDDFGFELKDCTWIDFKNGLDDYNWRIELTFLNDYLIWADIEPFAQKPDHNFVDFNTNK